MRSKTPTSQPWALTSATTPDLRVLAIASHHCRRLSSTCSRPTPPTHFSGARLAACGKEACGGGQERDGAGTLPPPRSSPPLACHIAALVITPHTHTHTLTQEQAWFVVAPKAGHKKTEQARRRGDPVSSPPPHALTLRISAHLELRSIYVSPSFRRTTRSSLGTRSSACSKSPRSFSTRTRRPRQQWS